MNNTASDEEKLCVKCWEFNPPLNDDDICKDCEADMENQDEIL